MRWPIQPVPGDYGTPGQIRAPERNYRKARLVLTTPTLPVRVHFRNALPASAAQIIIGQPRAAIGVRWPYTGITTPELFPIIAKRRPWE